MSNLPKFELFNSEVLTSALFYELLYIHSNVKFIFLNIVVHYKQSSNSIAFLSNNESSLSICKSDSKLILFYHK